MEKTNEKVWFYVAYTDKINPLNTVRILSFEYCNDTDAFKRFFAYLHNIGVDRENIIYAFGDDEEVVAKRLMDKCEDLNKLPSEKENKSKGDDYRDTSSYHGASGVYEPINVMDYMAKEYVKRGIPADKAMELCLSLKYLLRLGTKDDVEKELFKAENFIHRARCGKWMEPEKNRGD